MSDVTIIVPPGPCCLRCGHMLCPCCPLPWCDTSECLGLDDDTEPGPCADECEVPPGHWEAWQEDIELAFQLAGYPTPPFGLDVAEGPFLPPEHRS